MSKMSLLVGFGAGYVLGARAGRERYEQIAGKARQVWSDPRVQERAGKAQEALRSRTGSGSSGPGSPEGPDVHATGGSTFGDAGGGQSW